MSTLIPSDKYNKIIILLFGRTSAGKTSILNKFIGRKLFFTSSSQATLYPSIITHGQSNVSLNKNKMDNDAEVKCKSNTYTVDLSEMCDKVEVNKKNVIIIDFPGFTESKYDNVFNSDINKLLFGYGSLALYITDPARIDDETCKNDLKFITSKFKNVHILLNKIDNDEEFNEENDEKSIGILKDKLETLSVVYKCDTYMCSARTGNNLKKIYNIISSHYKKMVDINVKVEEAIKENKTPVLVMSEHILKIVEIENRLATARAEKSKIIVTIIGGIVTSMGLVVTLFSGGILFGVPTYISRVGLNSTMKLLMTISQSIKRKISATMNFVPKRLFTEKTSFTEAEIKQYNKFNINFGDDVLYPEVDYDDHKYILIDQYCFCVSGIFTDSTMKKVSSICEVIHHHSK